MLTSDCSDSGGTCMHECAYDNNLFAECCREGFGYISPNWRDPPSTDQKYLRKRAMQVQITLQCG